MSPDPFSCSCFCPSVPGKSISQTQANRTTITTRVRSPAGPGPRTWMTWRVRKVGSGRAFGRWLLLTCDHVTFSHCSSSQTRGCRVSDLLAYPSVPGATRGVGVVSPFDPCSVGGKASSQSPCGVVCCGPSPSQARGTFPPLTTSIPALLWTLPFGSPAGNRSSSSHRHYSRSLLSHSLTPHLRLLAPPQCPWAS